MIPVKPCPCGGYTDIDFDENDLFEVYVYCSLCGCQYAIKRSFFDLSEDDKRRIQTDEDGTIDLMNEAIEAWNRSIA